MPPIEPWLAASGGALAGAVVGSFLAALVLRWPQGRSVAHGRSACDGCGRTLSPLDLIPLISWVGLRGRCRSCGARIDPLHPTTEALAAMIGGAALWLAPGPGGLALALLGWLLLPLALIDARHYWLPHRLSLLLGIAGLLFGGVAMSAIGLNAGLADRAIGAAVGFGGLCAVGRGYRLVRGRDGLGGGDPPLLGAIGAWIGWSPLPFVLLFAASAGIAVALVRRAGGADAATMRLPLGTLLALATPAALAALTALPPV